MNPDAYLQDGNEHIPDSEHTVGHTIFYSWPSTFKVSKVQKVQKMQHSYTNLLIPLLILAVRYMSEELGFQPLLEGPLAHIILASNLKTL